MITCFLLLKVRLTSTLYYLMYVVQDHHERHLFHLPHPSPVPSKSSAYGIHPPPIDVVFLWDFLLVLGLGRPSSSQASDHLGSVRDLCLHCYNYLILKAA